MALATTEWAEACLTEWVVAATVATVALAATMAALAATATAVDTVTRATGATRAATATTDTITKVVGGDPTTATTVDPWVKAELAATAVAVMEVATTTAADRPSSSHVGLSSRQALEDGGAICLADKGRQLATSSNKHLETDQKLCCSTIVRETHSPCFPLAARRAMLKQQDQNNAQGTKNEYKNKKLTKKKRL